VYTRGCCHVLIQENVFIEQVVNKGGIIQTGFDLEWLGLDVESTHGAEDREEDDEFQHNWLASRRAVTHTWAEVGATTIG